MNNLNWEMLEDQINEIIRELEALKEIIFKLSIKQNEVDKHDRTRNIWKDEPVTKGDV